MNRWVEREITERPHALSCVAAFMPAHSKTPYITTSMAFSSGKGVIRGCSWKLPWAIMGALGLLSHRMRMQKTGRMAQGKVWSTAMQQTALAQGKVWSTAMRMQQTGRMAQGKVWSTTMRA